MGAPGSAFSTDLILPDLRPGPTLLHCRQTKSEEEVTQLWWFSREVVSDSCNPMDYSPPGSSVRGILQARILVGDCHFLLLYNCVHGFSKHLRWWYLWLPPQNSCPAHLWTLVLAQDWSLTGCGDELLCEGNFVCSGLTCRSFSRHEGCFW